MTPDHSLFTRLLSNLGPGLLLFEVMLSCLKLDIGRYSHQLVSLPSGLLSRSAREDCLGGGGSPTGDCLHLGRKSLYSGLSADSFVGIREKRMEIHGGL